MRLRCQLPSCLSRWAACILAGCLLTVVVWACQKDQPIRIGFSGPRTGRLSDPGLSGRNGVVLAVEERNATGGIDGEATELIQLGCRGFIQKPLNLKKLGDKIRSLLDHPPDTAAAS